jgi:hypothetical protein
MVALDAPAAKAADADPRQDAAAAESRAGAASGAPQAQQADPDATPPDDSGFPLELAKLAFAAPVDARA